MEDDDGKDNENNSSEHWKQSMGPLQQEILQQGIYRNGKQRPKCSYRAPIFLHTGFLITEHVGPQCDAACSSIVMNTLNSSRRLKQQYK
jgi:hypothetical protein